LSKYVYDVGDVVVAKRSEYLLTVKTLVLNHCLVLKFLPVTSINLNLSMLPLEEVYDGG